MMMLRRLRRAVQKLRFIMSLATNRLRFIVFKDDVHVPSNRGLLDVVVSNNYTNDAVFTDHTHIVSDDVSTPAESGITRTISNTWSAINRSLSGTFSPKPFSLPSKSSSTAAFAGDVDKRADHFIANFYKRLQMERQISLELRYASSSPREPSVRICLE